MAMQTCSAHGKPKTHHCFVCHKPLCGECSLGAKLCPSFAPED